MHLVLGIGEFITHGIETVSKLESVVKHVHKYEQNIDFILQSMVTANLMKFPPQDKSNDLPGRSI